MTICRRKSDGTLWSPAGDCPYPETGFNFVPAIERRWFIFSWWARDYFADRWVFYDSGLFDIAGVSCGWRLINPYNSNDKNLTTGGPTT